MIWKDLDETRAGIGLQPGGRQFEGLRAERVRYRDKIRADLESLLLRDGEENQPGVQFLSVDDGSAQRLAREVPVPVAAGDTLREDKVVRLEAERDRVPPRPRSWPDHDPNETLLPPRGRLRRLRADTVGVVP